VQHGTPPTVAVDIGCHAGGEIVDQVRRDAATNGTLISLHLSYILYNQRAVRKGTYTTAPTCPPVFPVLVDDGWVSSLYPYPMGWARLIPHVVNVGSRSRLVFILGSALEGSSSCWTKVTETR
jgi:hypothetical protein